MALTHKAHQLIKEAFPEIHCAIDATCGNGHDTLFLAGLCAEQGKVFAFDIQQRAIQATSERLKDNNLSEAVSLFCISHELLVKHVIQPVEVIMFNLGYLPGAEKKMTTQSTSTITALNSACEILAKNGLLSVLCYPGHAEGKIETDQVKPWLNALDKKQYSVEVHQSTVPTDVSPVLFIIRRLLK